MNSTWCREELGATLWLVTTEWQLDDVLSRSSKSEYVSLDTETNGLSWSEGNRIAGVSIGWKEGAQYHSCYIPVRHETSLARTLSGFVKDRTSELNRSHIEKWLDVSKPEYAQLPTDLVFTKLQDFISSREERSLVFHNAKFDLAMFREDGVTFRPTAYVDTMTSWQLFNENAPKALKDIVSGWMDKDTYVKHKGLIGPTANRWEKIVSEFRGIEARAYKEKRQREIAEAMKDPILLALHQGLNKPQLKKEVSKLFPETDVTKDDIGYQKVPIEIMWPYAALDTYFTLFLHDYLNANLSLTGTLKRVYDNELELIDVLLRAEQGGIYVDKAYLEGVRETIKEESCALDRDISEELPGTNINSPIQLADALQKIGLHLTETTKTGKTSVNSEVLSEVATDYPVVGKILKYRELNKLLGTYVEPALNAKDSVIHCTFNPNVKTGRMSSQDPNLQNIPGKTDIIRKAFVTPSDDYIFVFADYSQVEVRLTAHYSRDKTLLDSYLQGLDAHTNTAATMFEQSYDTLMALLDKEDKLDPAFAEAKALRSAAKTINFAVIYGITGQGLANKFPRPARFKNLSKEDWIKECDNFKDMYLDALPGVKRFIRETEEEVSKKGVVYNYFGRPRRLQHVWSVGPRSRGLVAQAKRQAVNFLVQSTAADVFKHSVVRVDHVLQGSKSRLCNFVHDEVQIYLHKDDIGLLNNVRDAMEDWSFRVPLRADFSWSPTSWGEKKSIKV